ncbi:MAG: hypothetical protein HUU25_03665 [Candidatus Sumerlaeia bacterium]|nr:hypothetical protein [Candidatus Sumerlaeia bacterium]
MGIVRRSASLLCLGMAMGSGGLLGCGGPSVPEAVKEPLLVTPGGARLVGVADVRSQRDLNNFIGFWDFLRNRDADPAYRNRLPFDYQEFVDHWHVDPVRNIDKAVYARYDGGAWLTVLVGQYEPDHLMSLLSAQGALGTAQRGGTEDVDPYTLLEVRARGGMPENLFDSAVNLMVNQLPNLGPAATALRTGDVVRDSVFHAWPTRNIWLRSNDRTLMGQALDLWDGVPGEDLLDDRAFTALYNARPHSALLWAGMPRTAGLPSPLATMELELDIRDYFSPTLIFGFDTEEAASAALAPWERLAEGARQWMTSIEQQAADTLSQDPMTRLAGQVEGLELTQIFYDLAGRLRVQLIRPQRIIQIAMPLPINDFKTVLIALTRAFHR